MTNEVSEVSHNPSSRSTLPMKEEARSGSPVLRSAVEARTKLENAINQARSQTRSLLSVFRPVEFESTPVSSHPYRSYVRSEAIPEVTHQGKGIGYVKLDDEVSVARPVGGRPCCQKHGGGEAIGTTAYQHSHCPADSEVFANSQPVKVTPRQPYSQSLLDPAAPTRVFGSTGQREVTVVKRGKGQSVVEALVSGDDSNWSWSSVEQLGQAVDELVRVPKSQSLSSHGLSLIHI